MKAQTWAVVIGLAALLASCAKPQPPARTSAAAGARVREGRWKIRDTRLFVRDVGPTEAPVLLVLHGGPGGNHRSLRALEALSPPYRVVLYDQRGTGESDRLDVSPARPQSLQRLSLQENVADIEALRVALGRETISVIGHSWGGALAVFYAAAHPRRVARLIVYSGGPETRQLAERKRRAHGARLTAEERTSLGAQTKALAAAVKRGAPQEELDKRFVRLASVMFPSLYCERPAATGHGDLGRGGFWANQAAGSYVETFAYEASAAQLRAVRAPALLIWGRCEPSPRERLTNLLDRLPDARFVIFDRSGHNAMEEERKLFFATIRAFLAGRPLPVKAFTSRAGLPG